MEKVIEVLMRRDGLSHDDAVAEYRAGMDAVCAELYENGSAEAEEMFMDWFGLEPDYLMECLC